MPDASLPEVVAAIEAPTTVVTRRLEILESDGVTLWEGAGTDSRLIDGSVTVDYDRDERRGIDVTLDNTDGLLAHDPVNGLWYDKIIKVYRGIEYYDAKTQPKILVIYDSQSRIVSELRNLGFNDVTKNTAVTSISQFTGYDIIVADAYQSAIPAPTVALLQAGYSAGYAVFTCSNEGDQTVLPFVTASITKTAGTDWALTKPTYDSPLVGTWNSVATFGTSDVGKLPTAILSTAAPVATMTFGSTVGYVVLANANSDQTRWVHLGIAELQGDTRAIARNAITWLWNHSLIKTYETQLGTFMIDSITEDYFPNRVKITGRDYAKKMLLSKITQGLTFANGTDIGTIIGAVAANADVLSTTVNTSGVTLNSDLSFEANTSRWDIVKQICEAYQFEVFFNRYGVLIVRPFFDPLTSPISLELLTGTSGNLVNYTKSSNDSRIFNHVTVTSDNQDSVGSGTLIFAEALNTEPSSPTRIDRMGDRLYAYTSSAVADLHQAQNVANSFLRVMGLEEFTINFDVLVYPWLEAGEIVEFTDPKAGNGVPDRFLLTSFNVPLGLGTMSATSKRVTIVGGGSVPGEVILDGV